MNEFCHISIERSVETRKKVQALGKHELWVKLLHKKVEVQKWNKGRYFV
jgi:hypothetical protein